MRKVISIYSVPKHGITTHTCCFNTETMKDATIKNRGSSSLKCSHRHCRKTFYITTATHLLFLLRSRAVILTFLHIFINDKVFLWYTLHFAYQCKADPIEEHVTFQMAAMFTVRRWAATQHYAYGVSHDRNNEIIIPTPR